MRVWEVVGWTLLAVWMGYVWWRWHRPGQETWAANKQRRRPWRLRAKEPGDCPSCCAGEQLRRVNGEPQRPRSTKKPYPHLIHVNLTGLASPDSHPVLPKYSRTPQKLIGGMDKRSAALSSSAIFC